MGFFSKAKAFLNIGGVSVELNVPEQVERYGGAINGYVVLTTKSEQLVKSIEIELEEHFFEGYGDERVMKKHYLGSLKIEEAFTIKTGEERRVDFELPFIVQNTINDNLRAHGGIYGVIGTIGEMVEGELSRYYVNASADVESAAFDPVSVKEIRLVGDRIPEDKSQVAFDKEIYGNIGGINV